MFKEDNELLNKHVFILLDASNLTAEDLCTAQIAMVLSKWVMILVKRCLG